MIMDYVKKVLEHEKKQLEGRLTWLEENQKHIQLDLEVNKKDQLLAITKINEINQALGAYQCEKEK
jgi:hypothetical protein